VLPDAEVESIGRRLFWGAFINSGQICAGIKRVLVADALAGGAKAVAAGGPLDRPGYFFAPTILTGLAEGTRIVDEEQSGPALPVMSTGPSRKRSTGPARPRSGLSGSAWGTDTDQAARVAAQLDSGVVFVNDHLAPVPRTLTVAASAGQGANSGHEINVASMQCPSMRLSSSAPVDTER
jgi:acyl-CoA reductase-like NAD-dependent aldehyde dehydrogenase